MGGLRCRGSPEQRTIDMDSSLGDPMRAYSLANVMSFAPG
jgi:hypothetical protein